jgi:RNA polymerase sigma-70 factor (ECF subfamily)
VPPVIAGRSSAAGELSRPWTTACTEAGTDWCLKAVAANGQPGFAAYRRVGGGYELHTLQIFTVTAEGISRNSVFQDAEVFASFGLPAGLDAQGLVLAS